MHVVPAPTIFKNYDIECDILRQSDEGDRVIRKMWHNELGSLGAA